MKRVLGLEANHLGVHLPPTLGVGVYRDRWYRRGIAWESNLQRTRETGRRRKEKELSKEEVNGVRRRKGKGSIRFPPPRRPPQRHGGPFASAVACATTFWLPRFLSSPLRFEDRGKRIPEARDYS